MELRTPSTGTPAQDDPTMDLGGRCVGNSYILLREIGHGATGTVWRAVDRTNGEQVAVKLLREHLVRQPKQVTRFVQERAILLMLRHAHIVRVRDLLTVGDTLGLVMDLVDGGSLRDLLHEHGPLPSTEAAELLGQVADALTEAHRLGVVHRDLKPDNILVHRVDGRLDTRLTDFGIARVLNTPGLTTPEALIGTPNYLAPEAINGARPSPATDVYSLGVLLYEMIVGRAPYRGGAAAAVLRRHIEDEPYRYPGIPDPVWEVITACMAKDPARRPTAGELVRMLSSVRDATVGVRALAAPQPTSSFDDSDAEDEDAFVPRPAHPSLVPAPPPRRRPRNRVAAWRWVRPGAIVALIVAALILAGAPAFDSWRARDGDGTPATTTSHPAGALATGGTAAPATPSARGSAAVPGAGAAPPPAPAAVSVSTPAGRAETSVRPYGPWQCASYHAEAGHPVLARPCYAVGDAIRILGHMAAMPGVQADVTMSVQEATSGTTVSGPYTCRALMFTDSAPTQDCGPFDLDDVPHGHRYVVVQSWQYTGRSFLPNGTTKGPEFPW